MNKKVIKVIVAIVAGVVLAALGAHVNGVVELISGITF